MDPDGLDFWTEQVDQYGIDAVREPLTHSPEAQEFVYTDDEGQELSNEEVVNNIYESRRGQTHKCTVLIDTESDWLSTDQGDPMFDSEGNPNEVLNKRIELLKNQAPNPNRDTPGLHAIDQSGILEPWPETLENLYKVNQQQLAALDDQTFLELRQKNALAAIYAQLMSMPRINRVRNLAKRKQKMRDRMNVVWKQPVDDFSLSFDDEVISFEGLDTDNE